MEEHELAGRCFFFHKWTRWTIDTQEEVQARACIRCGLAQKRSYKLIVDDGKCAHEWRPHGRHDIDSPNGTTVSAVLHIMRCRKCGEMTGRRVDFRGVTAVGPEDKA